MKKEIITSLRMSEELYEALFELSKKMFGKVQVSRLMRLVLERYVKEVLLNEDINSSFNNKL